MTQRLFLYIDILGFKDLVRSKSIVPELYRRIDKLHVHTDNAFTCIVFSDTILVYSHDGWLDHPREAIMWLIEFAQDLFYSVISLDIHFRAYITQGEFDHQRLEHVEAYYGDALIECYEREKLIKCTGVFLDEKLAKHSHIFFLTKYDDYSFFVHVMQNLDAVSFGYSEYPISGFELEQTGMEWWTAYPLHYLRNIYQHANDQSHPLEVREKYQNAWKMISSRHEGLCRRLVESNFVFGDVIKLDWTEKLARIGTKEGAFR